MTATRQPVRASALEVFVNGAVGSGQMTIQGLVAGSTTTEILTYAASGYKQSTKLFSSIIGITTSGLADEPTPPQVQIRAVARDGSSQESSYEIRRDVPCAVAQDTHSWASSSQDARQPVGNASIIFPFEEVWSPRKGDMITDELSRLWEVLDAPLLSSSMEGPFWEVRARRAELG
jgi:hypothetical protein